MIAGMVEESCARGEDAALLTARMEDPTGYGRILTDGEGRVQGIVEHRDATEEQRQVKLINTLSGCYRGDLLLRYLDQLTCDNAQGEYYLTDVVGLMVRDGYKVGIALCPQRCRGHGRERPGAAGPGRGRYARSIEPALDAGGGHPCGSGTHPDLGGCRHRAGYRDLS